MTRKVMVTQSQRKEIRKFLAPYCLGKETMQVLDWWLGDEKAAERLDTAMADLKPCPFCGRPVNLEHDAFSSDNALRIHCANCDVQMWAMDGEMPDALIKRWNARPRPLTKKELEDEIPFK